MDEVQVDRVKSRRGPHKLNTSENMVCVNKTEWPKKILKMQVKGFNYRKQNSYFMYLQVQM